MGMQRDPRRAKHYKQKFQAHYSRPPRLVDPLKEAFLRVRRETDTLKAIEMASREMQAEKENRRMLWEYQMLADKKLEEEKQRAREIYPTELGWPPPEIGFIDYGNSDPAADIYYIKQARNYQQSPLHRPDYWYYEQRDQMNCDHQPREIKERVLHQDGTTSVITTMAECKCVGVSGRPVTTLESPVVERDFTKWGSESEWRPHLVGIVASIQDWEVT